MVAVVDYNAGNLRSVTKALESLGACVRVTGIPGDLETADKIVLPGVGAFGQAAETLEKRGLKTALLRTVGAGKPFLGICLGMQLLYDRSEESPGSKGLGLIPGTVVRFAAGLKVPHLGWNQVFHADRSPLWDGVPDGAFFYFAHSYAGVPEDEDSLSGRTEYGVSFASAVRKGVLFGLQFHPEKSQQWGLRILENFVRL